jgi:hypothetical protein
MNMFELLDGITDCLRIFNEELSISGSKNRVNLDTKIRGSESAIESIEFLTLLLLLEDYFNNQTNGNRDAFSMIYDDENLLTCRQIAEMFNEQGVATKTR